MFKQAHQKMISRTKMAGDATDKMVSPFRNELTFRFSLIRHMFNLNISWRVFSLNFL